MKIVNTNIDKKVLEWCEFAIHTDLSALADLPYELANTVANVYYRYHRLGFSLKGAEFPYFAKDNVDITKMQPSDFLNEQQVKSMEDYYKFKADINAVPEMIKGLRSIDKHQSPRLYQYWVDFILDCLKYNIKHAERKTGLRRKIERIFKKDKINEIPNLVDLMDFNESKSDLSNSS